MSAAAPSDTAPAHPLEMHFYYVRDRLAYDSLRAHAQQVGHLSPVWLDVDAKGALVNNIEKDIVAWSSSRRIRLMPVVMNKGFSGDSVAAATGPARRKLTAALVQVAAANRFEGLQLDFEGLRAVDREPYAEFAEQLAAGLHARGMQFSVAVPAPLADDPAKGWVASQQSASFDYARLSAAADFVTLMAYDEYTSPGQPGPVAGIAWVEACVRQLLTWSPASKIMLGVPLYHRHWAAKTVSEGPYAAATALALRGQTEIRLDPTQEEATLQFSDARGDHVVWLGNRRQSDAAGRSSRALRSTRHFGMAAWPGRPGCVGFHLCTETGEDSMKKYSLALAGLMPLLSASGAVHLGARRTRPSEIEGGNLFGDRPR